MNKVRNTVPIAVLLALVVIAPASVLMGITYQLSRNETMSSMLFFGTFLADLVGVCWWASQHLAPTAQGARMNVHQFIAHMKMHPEHMPADMTEFDLERFRTRHVGRSQARLDAWVRRFRHLREEATKAARPTSQFR